MSDRGTPHGPTVERLLDVRTPAELAISPDGARVLFALHATVADVGPFVPSDLYLADVPGGALVQLTDGTWCDQSPVWSPDGARVAFLRPDYARTPAAVHARAR